MGRVRVHVIGNTLTVDIGVSGALETVIIGAVGAGMGRSIRRGDATVGGQAEVGAIGAGGVVLIAAAVVRGAMGIKDHQAALLHGFGDVVHGGICHGVTNTGAARRAVEVLPGGLIVGRIAGKGGVGITGAGLPIGLDQANIGRGGTAATDSLINLQQRLGISLGPGNLLGAGIICGVVKLSLHSGIITAGNPNCGHPNQKAAVLLQGIGYIAL